MAWRRLKGKSRRYKNDDTGQELSDRAMRKLRELQDERTVFSNARLARQRSAQARYNSTLRSYVEKERASGKSIKLGEARKSADFATKYKRLSDLGRTRPSVKIKSKSRRKVSSFNGHKYYSSNTKQAQMRRILRDLGKREGIPDWVPVGLSADYREGRLTSKDQLK